jgi:tetratricopeptide (TPR) repeat protein
LTTRDNILYNGGLALESGIESLKSTYKDNFWEILPIERMQIIKLASETDEAPKNANFELAETKATKAIQKHSMNIGGVEKNPQIDESHLMLGKARYYDQRFIPALEAFNYILYKYQDSDKIYEAKIWREKTNIRLENEGLAIKNLSALLKEIKKKDQVFADANAALAQAFINVEQKDSAVAKLRLATQYTKSKEEKARYRFVLGQIFENLAQKDSAFLAYQSVIDMKRKSPRQYVIQSHLKQASLYDFEKEDTVLFLKKFNKLLLDRENRPFLDALHHELGLFYDKNKNTKNAITEYNKSLKAKSQDPYLVASNYRNLATIYFYKPKYITAGKYYDSTLVKLDNKSKEYKLIKKKRENLDDVIKYEGIANRNDSILNVVSLSIPAREAYYNNYISQLKKDEEQKKVLQQKAALKEKTIKENGVGFPSGKTNEAFPEMNVNPAKTSKAPIVSPTIGAKSDFYFYNFSTVEFGKLEFKKNWGTRKYENNWRRSSAKPNTDLDQEETETNELESTQEKPKESEVLEPKYTADFYLKQLPKDFKVLDSLAKTRNFAYYQLGIIYKEKFKEYLLAANKFEKLLLNNPEERLILPTMYNLFKIYEIIDTNKAMAMKERIINLYPESRYAEILKNPNPENTLEGLPEIAYAEWYKIYESGDYRTIYEKLEQETIQFSGEEIISKMEFLKASVAAKLLGVSSYKKGLNFVLLNYPNSPEGKEADALLKKDIPALEALKFDGKAAKSWKLLYKVNFKDTKTIKTLQDKINIFVGDHTSDHLSTSFDIFTLEDNFIVIHGIISAEFAKGIITILKEYKDYKISQTPILISNYNYKVLQIKKNLDEFLAPPPAQVSPSAVVPNTTTAPPVVPNQSVIPSPPAPKNLQKSKQLTEEAPINPVLPPEKK